MREDLKLSKIKLADLTPYVSTIHGLFCVPFGDGGFFWNTETIKTKREAYEERFVNVASMLMGITVGEVRKKMYKKNDSDLSKPYNWCWRHNVDFRIKKNVENKVFHVSTFINENGWYRLSIYDVCNHSIELGDFFMNDKGMVYQSDKNEQIFNSVDEIVEKVKNINIESINKELKELRKTEARMEKSLNAVRGKIKNLEKKLNQ